MPGACTRARCQLDPLLREHDHSTPRRDPSSGQQRSCARSRPGAARLEADEGGVAGRAGAQVVDHAPDRRHAHLQLHLLRKPALQVATGASGVVQTLPKEPY